MKQMLQIIHVSDLHVCTIRHANVSETVRRFGVTLTKLAKWVPEPVSAKVDKFGRFIQQGAMFHDPQAVPQFVRLVNKVTTHDEKWQSPTWLVDTGDLSLFGDDDSIVRAKGYLKRFAHGLNDSEVYLLYGNHDAWPGDFPLGCDPNALRIHKKNLRAVHFPRRFPHLALHLDGDPVEFRLYGVNSVLHDDLWNAAGFGSVDYDCPWEHIGNPPAHEHQLAKLKDLVLAEKAETPVVRLLALHHPIHFPRGMPWDLVCNRKQIADSLGGSGCRHFHAVLSGHTHAYLPAVGSLPTSLTTAVHPPLRAEQLQFVVGSLLQNSVDEEAIEEQSMTGPPPHQAQILRFYWNDADRTVHVQRRAAYRRPWDADFLLEEEGEWSRWNRLG